MSRSPENGIIPIGLDVFQDGSFEVGTRLGRCDHLIALLRHWENRVVDYEVIFQKIWKTSYVPDRDRDVVGVNVGDARVAMANTPQQIYTVWATGLVFATRHQPGKELPVKSIREWAEPADEQTWGDLADLVAGLLNMTVVNKGRSLSNGLSASHMEVLWPLMAGYPNMVVHRVFQEILGSEHWDAEMGLVRNVMSKLNTAVGTWGYQIKNVKGESGMAETTGGYYLEKLKDGEVIPKSRRRKRITTE